MKLAAPFPYFGGKRRAAPLIWDALGDPAGYVEPFAGSAATLLMRPPFKGRRVETLNDADGWLVNAWRSIQHAPDHVADHAHGPVAEIDYHARLAWLQERRTPDLVAWLEGHPEHYDAKAAGWWLYVMACGIGDPWGAGPWRVVNHRLVKNGNAGQGVNRKLPHLGNAGKEQLAAYMQALAHRLSRVRITCGDWRRVLTPSVTRSGAGGDGSRAVFLDPPYSTGSNLYAASGDDAAQIADQVREWCRTADASLRIVLAGYDVDHAELERHGWGCIKGKAGRGAGYSVNSGNGRRERLWLSPACIHADQLGLGL
jgi:hypothetical protein